MGTLRLSWPTRSFWATVFYSIFIAVSLVGMLETVARNPRTQNYLLYPSFGSSYRQLDRQLQLLDQFVWDEGPLDCIFIGDSTVLGGIHPETVNAAFAETAGRPISCYTFGVGAISIQNIADLTEAIAYHYAPEHIVIGTHARNVLAPNDFYATDSAWISYQLGHWSISGWLFNHSISYRYLQAYLRWSILMTPDQRIAKDKADRYFTAVQPNGYSAAISVDYGNHYSWEWETQMMAFYPWYFRGKEITHDDVIAWDRILALQSKTHLYVLEMPVQVGYLFTQKYNQLSFSEAILRTACDQGLPTWYTIGEISFLGESYWQDPLHLNADGSILFSQWVGEQLAKATSHCPIMPTMPIHLGLTADQYERFEAMHPPIDPTPTMIFNPSFPMIDRLAEQTALGTALQYTPELDESSILELLFYLEKMHYETELTLTPQQQADLLKWRNTLDPIYLQSLGVRYLLFNTAWTSYLSEQNWENFNNPEHYQWVETWENLPGAYDYSLYRVISND